MLLEDETAVDRIPSLYAYRVQCIPKHAPPQKAVVAMEGQQQEQQPEQQEHQDEQQPERPKQKFRPICVQEVFLTVLHRHIARRLQDLIQVSEYQYCFRPAGRNKALRRAKKLLENHRLLQLDVKNAFGSIPHAQIIKMLRLRNPGNKVVAYIQRFLNARHSKDLTRIHQGVGVPQGDPMSMFLFALGVDPVIQQIQDELGEISAYADDIVIALKPEITPQYAVTRAIQIYGEIGLKIQPDKCTITGQGDPVFFLGHPFQENQPLTIAEHINKTAKRKLAILNHFDGLKRASAFVMLNRSLVPALNYGPLVENGGLHEALGYYQDIDKQILAALRHVLRLGADVSDEEIRAFAIAQKCDGGLEFMLPGEYFPVMIAHGDALIYGDPTNQLKREYFDSFYYRRHGFVPPDKPPVAAVLPYADLLTDTQFTKLVNFHFGGRVPPERCTKCGKTGTHDPKCPGYMDMVWKVHNDALAYLLGSMQGNRTATRRQTVLNGPEGRHLSDGYFTGQDGNVYVVDTSIAWNNDLAGRYRRKMRHAEVPEYFIPFVFTMDGKIYEESRKRIQAAAPEITDDVLARATLIPLATRQANRITVVARETLGDLSQMFPEVSVHWCDSTTEPNHVEAPGQKTPGPDGQAQQGVAPTAAPAPPTQAAGDATQTSGISRVTQQTADSQRAPASQSGISMVQDSDQPTLESRSALPDPRDESSQIADGAPWSSLGAGVAALSASISNTIMQWLQRSGLSLSEVSRRSGTSSEHSVRKQAGSSSRHSDRASEHRATHQPTQQSQSLPAGQATQATDPPAENANQTAGNPPTSPPGRQSEDIIIEIDGQPVDGDNQPTHRAQQQRQPNRPAGAGKQGGRRQQSRAQQNGAVTVVPLMPVQMMPAPTLFVNYTEAQRRALQQAGQGTSALTYLPLPNNDFTSNGGVWTWEDPNQGRGARGGRGRV